MTWLFNLSYLLLNFIPGFGIVLVRIAIFWEVFIVEWVVERGHRVSHMLFLAPGERAGSQEDLNSLFTARWRPMGIATLLTMANFHSPPSVILGWRTLYPPKNAITKIRG